MIYRFIKFGGVSDISIYSFVVSLFSCTNRFTRLSRSQYRIYNTNATPTHAATTINHPRYSWHHCHHVLSERWAWNFRLACLMVNV